jgi:hypothetical protein
MIQNLPARGRKTEKNKEMALCKTEKKTRNGAYKRY